MCCIGAQWVPFQFRIDSILIRIRGWMIQFLHHNAVRQKVTIDYNSINEINVNGKWMWMWMWWMGIEYSINGSIFIYRDSFKSGLCVHMFNSQSFIWFILFITRDIYSRFNIFRQNSTNINLCRLVGWWNEPNQWKETQKKCVLYNSNSSQSLISYREHISDYVHY